MTPSTSARPQPTGNATDMPAIEVEALRQMLEKLNMTQLEYIEIITKALQNQVTIDKLLEQF